MTTRKKTLSLNALESISIGKSIVVNSAFSAQSISKVKSKLKLPVSSTTLLQTLQSQSEERQTPIQQSESIQQIEPAIKSMKFRQKRGTRIKQLMKNKFKHDSIYSPYSHYFGPSRLLESTSSQDSDFSINTEGLDSFDSDFGDDIKWKKKSSSQDRKFQFKVQNEELTKIQFETQQKKPAIIIEEKESKKIKSSREKDKRSEQSGNDMKQINKRKERINFDGRGINGEQKAISRKQEQGERIKRSIQKAQDGRKQVRKESKKQKKVIKKLRKSEYKGIDAG